MPRERVLAIKAVIAYVYRAANQAFPTDPAVQAIDLKVWAHALRDIPNEHLEECVGRALAGKRDTYMLCSAEILREWDAYKLEVAQQREAAQARKWKLLPGPDPEVCQTCAGAGWIKPSRYKGDYSFEKCPHCVGPHIEPKRDKGPRMTLSEWKVLHASKYPDGCDKENCVECYGTPWGGKIGAWPTGGAEYNKQVFERMNAIAPPPEVDAAIRASLSNNATEPGAVGGWWELGAPNSPNTTTSQIETQHRERPILEDIWTDIDQEDDDDDDDLPF